MNGFETETPKKHYKKDRTLRVGVEDILSKMAYFQGL